MTLMSRIENDISQVSGERRTSLIVLLNISKCAVYYTYKADSHFKEVQPVLADELQ